MALQVITLDHLRRIQEARMLLDALLEDGGRNVKLLDAAVAVLVQIQTEAKLLEDKK